MENDYFLRRYQIGETRLEKMRNELYGIFENFRENAQYAKSHLNNCLRYLKKGDSSCEEHSFPPPDFFHAYLSIEKALSALHFAGNLTPEEKRMKARMTGDRDWLRTKFEEGKVYISLADRLDIGCHSD